MIEINNPQLIARYMKTHDFNSIFDHDVSAITRLFFFPKGSYIISEGVIPDFIFFMVEGECRYLSLASSGSLVTYGGSKGFRVLGEVASLWDSRPTSSVQAVKDSYCLGISLPEHRDMLLNDNCFLRFIARLLAASITRLDNTITAHTSSTVQNRIASFIIQNSVDGVFNSSLVTISEAVGASYRHVLRLMHSLCAQKILRKNKRQFTIINQKALSDLASDSYGYFDLSDLPK